MRCAHITEEGIADLKRRGYRVRRNPHGWYSISDPLPTRPKAWRPMEGANSLARVASLWAGVDVAGADAWRVYADELHRRSRGRGARMSAYNAFVKVVTAALTQDPDTTPSLQPPVLPTPKRSPRKRSDNPTPTPSQREEV